MREGKKGREKRRGGGRYIIRREHDARQGRVLAGNGRGQGQGRASEARWASVAHVHVPSFYFIILLYFLRLHFRSSQRVPHPPTRPFVVPLHYHYTYSYTLDLLILPP
jgi:hypothetical protein